MSVRLSCECTSGSTSLVNKSSCATWSNIDIITGRQRKIRCIWEDDQASCNGCAMRGRSCQAQVFSAPVVDGIALTGRDRIRNLENKVTALWAVVKDLQAAAGHDVTRPATEPVSVDSCANELELTLMICLRPTLRLTHEPVQQWFTRHWRV
jgi:hypothetical protein